MQLLSEMMPCLTASLFSQAVFHRSLLHANMSKSSMLNISFPSNLIASFFTIALPMLLTNILFGSAVEFNSMLKERFAVPGTITSFTVTYMKHYSCSQSISYNATILVYYFQGQRINHTIFKLPVLGCVGFETCRVFRLVT